MRNIIIALAVAGILTSVALVAYFVVTNQGPVTEVVTPPAGSPTASPTASAPASAPATSPSPPTPNQAGLLPTTRTADWETYTGAAFSVQYPPQFEQSVQQGMQGSAVVLRYLGPTQTQGTEVFDGVILRMETGEMDASSLQAYVSDQRQQSDNSPQTSFTGQASQVTVAGLSGYQYTVRGLGEFQYIYLPAGQGEFLQIVALVEDPEGGGYQQTVDAILNSLSVE